MEYLHVCPSNSIVFIFSLFGDKMHPIWHIYCLISLTVFYWVSTSVESYKINTTKNPNTNYCDVTCKSTNICHTGYKAIAKVKTEK